MVIALLLVLVVGAGLLALVRSLLILLLVLRLVGLLVRTSATLCNAGVAGIVRTTLLTAGVGVVLVLLTGRTLVVAALLLACILALAGLLAALLVLLILLRLILLRLVLLSLARLLLLLTVVLLIGHVILLVIRSLEDAGGLDRRSVGENQSCLQAGGLPIGARRNPLWADMTAAVSGLLTWNAVTCWLNAGCLPVNNKEFTYRGRVSESLGCDLRRSEHVHVSPAAPIVRVLENRLDS